MIGKEYLLIGAEARYELLREENCLTLITPHGGIDFYVTVISCNHSSCWKGPLLVVASSVWVVGSKGTKTLNACRTLRGLTFRAQDLGQRHGAPTTDDDEDDYELYSE